MHTCTNFGSRSGLNGSRWDLNGSRWDLNPDDSLIDAKPDNVLLEYELANSLAKQGRMAVFPIFVGGGDTNKYHEDGSLDMMRLGIFKSFCTSPDPPYAYCIV